MIFRKSVFLIFLVSAIDFSHAKAQDKNLEVARLYGSIRHYAYYFLDILVGTPPQRQSVIIDSGSSLLGFPCKECKSCGVHIDYPFDPDASETSSWLDCHDRKKCFRKCQRESGDRCHYHQSYNEGSSIAGNYFSDMIAIGDVGRDNDFVKFDFIGCHDKETNLFTSQKANGIMGVSYQRGSRKQTIMDVLFHADDVDAKVFAICLADRGGVLTVGGYNSSYHRESENETHDSAVARRQKEKHDAFEAGDDVNWRRLAAVPSIAWTKIESDSSFSLALQSISLDGNRIARGTRDFGSALIDSGTTFSYFPPKVYRKLRETFLGICRKDRKCQASSVRGSSKPICWKAKSHSDTKHLPSVFLEFADGSKVEWKPDSYLYDKGQNEFCLAIEDNQEVTTVLGMSFMKNQDIIFDREASLIGFVPSDCPQHEDIDRPPPPEIGEPVRGSNLNIDEEEEATAVEESEAEKVSDDSQAEVAVEVATQTEVAAKKGWFLSLLQKNEHKSSAATASSSNDDTSKRTAGLWVLGSLSVAALVGISMCVARQTIKMRSGTPTYQTVIDVGDPGDAHEDLDPTAVDMEMGGIFSSVDVDMLPEGEPPDAMSADRGRQIASGVLPEGNLMDSILDDSPVPGSAEDILS